MKAKTHKIEILKDKMKARIKVANAIVELPMKSSADLRVGVAKLMAQRARLTNIRKLKAIMMRIVPSKSSSLVYRQKQTSTEYLCRLIQTFDLNKV